MPKWLDLNEVDDDEILLKKNRMSRSLVLDTPEVADAAEEDFLDTMEPAKKSMTIFFMIFIAFPFKKFIVFIFLVFPICQVYFEVRF